MPIIICRKRPLGEIDGMFLCTWFAAEAFPGVVIFRKQHLFHYYVT
jgi:uncharacterized protein YodC (DUF2158 family)